MERVPYLSFLPDDMILCVFLFLGYKELCQMSSLCRRMNLLSKKDNIWKELFKNIFFDVNINDLFFGVQLTWRERFQIAGSFFLQ